MGLGWAAVGAAERRGVNRCGELALLPEGVTRRVFDDRVLGATKRPVSEAFGCRLPEALRRDKWRSAPLAEERA